jgi:hypothetical protein
MNLSTDSYAEICKQTAFISALIAGFSFAFIGALLVSSINKRIVDWILAFSISSIAGLMLCSMGWTLSASRMAYYSGTGITEVPLQFVGMHQKLSILFSLSVFLFLITLGLSGWIRSKKLGIVSGIIAVVSLIFFVWLMKTFRI